MRVRIVRCCVCVYTYIAAADETRELLHTEKGGVAIGNA